ncbi:HAD-IA family hydrolase [Diaphorobacter aerolatus]|uniref:HAD-IA family hydrolase n=1 Tax=Diaphorobacter aerolatus TaxID=1288495 RepID=UPI0038517142
MIYGSRHHSPSTAGFLRGRDGRSRWNHGRHARGFRQGHRRHAARSETAGNRCQPHRTHGRQGLGAPAAVSAHPCAERERRWRRGGEGAATHARAWDRYQWHYERINGQYSTLYPGVADGLAALARAGYPMACLTNKPTAFAHELLKAKGLHGYFGHVFGGDAFERKKPDPMPLVKTCEALCTPPAKTLMVGDSSNDASAARAAGCPVVLVTYGYNHGEPIRSVNADAFVDSLTELA